MTEPTTTTFSPVLEDDAIYIVDGGQVLHGRCCGATARYTGRDISGQKVERLTEEALDQVERAIGRRLTCEVCR